jgi:hypothetical protein
VEFSRELRDDVLAGDITVSVRLWKRPQVKEGGRYRVGPGLIEVDAIELVPFAAITEADVRRAGEPDRERLRERAAHAGPVDEDTLVYRIELHAVSPEDRRAFLSDDSRCSRAASSAPVEPPASREARARPPLHAAAHRPSSSAPTSTG